MGTRTVPVLIAPREWEAEPARSAEERGDGICWRRKAGVEARKGERKQPTLKTVGYFRPPSDSRTDYSSLSSCFTSSSSCERAPVSRRLPFLSTSHSAGTELIPNRKLISLFQCLPSKYWGQGILCFLMKSNRSFL